MPMHILYYSVTLSLVLDALSFIGVDSDVLTKVSSTVDAEPLVLSSLAIWLSFYSHLS